MVKVLFKDNLGNRIVESRNKGIGLQNVEGKYCIGKDFRDFVKEHKLTKDIKFKKSGDVWISNKLLGYG